MENKAHAIAAGAFVIMVAALLVGLAVWLTRDTTERRAYELVSAYGVTGLQPQAGVRYKGVLVGRVTDIKLDDEKVGNVRVGLAVDVNAPITKSTFATLGFQGITGLAYVQLDDSGESQEALETSNKKPARIPMRANVFSRLSEQGTGLMNQVVEVGTKVNQLLEPKNQKVMIDAIAQIGQAATSMRQLAQRADSVLQTQSADLNLPQLGREASTTLQAMKATSERLGLATEAMRKSAEEFKAVSVRMNEPGGTLEKIAHGADALAATNQTLNATLVPRLNRVADETARTVRQVNRTVEGVNENPQSLILGRGAAAPGPGEAGFSPPTPR
jgi:phospholipid/cholesterol/gamma-HCH transport system substrate-binding protein